MAKATTRFKVRVHGVRGTGNAVEAKNEKQACEILYRDKNLSGEVIMYVQSPTPQIKGQKPKKYLVQLHPRAEVYREPEPTKPTKPNGATRPKPKRKSAGKRTRGARKVTSQPTRPTTDGIPRPNAFN